MDSLKCLGYRKRGCTASEVVVMCCCRRAKDLMQSNISVLHKTAEVLLEREQIDGDEFLRLILESQAESYLKADEPSVTVPYQAVPSS